MLDSFKHNLGYAKSFLSIIVAIIFLPRPVHDPQEVDLVFDGILFLPRKSNGMCRYSLKILIYVVFVFASLVSSLKGL